MLSQDPSSSQRLSASPSVLPSLSRMPSSLPTGFPTGSSMPSTGPSGSPTSKLSLSPSHSVGPSSVPSASPSVSQLPSSQPSVVPTGSSMPSPSPSLAPSSSLMPSSSPSKLPSSEPSQIPTGSSMPSADPLTKASNMVASPSSLGQKSVIPPTSTHARLRETVFSTSCSQGYYGESNVDIISADGEAVTFRLSQPFLSGLERYAVWFDNPEQGESEDFCYFSDFVPSGKIYSEFKAKCTLGSALISVYGGHDGDFKQIGIDTSLIPEARCQAPLESEFPEYNPNARCYWEFKIDCFDVEDRQLQIEESTAGADGAASCEELSKKIDVATIEIGHRCTAPEVTPVKIESQNGRSVTFSLSQVWKGCGVDGAAVALDWLAADFDDAENKYECVGQASLKCGAFSSFTSGCIDGVAVIDVYATDDELFYGENIAIPKACSSPLDGRNSCQYRYVLQCQPSLCKAQSGKKDSPRIAIAPVGSFLRSLIPLG